MSLDAPQIAARHLALKAALKAVAWLAAVLFRIRLLLSGENVLEPLLTARDPVQRAWDRVWLSLPAPGRRFYERLLVVIPFRDRWDLTSACLESILSQEFPPGLHVTLGLVNNRSSGKEHVDGLEKLRLRLQEQPAGRRLEIETMDFDEPFNFSRMNNAAVARWATEEGGQLLLFLNNDTEFLQKDGLARMTSFFDASLVRVADPAAGQLPVEEACWRVGAVGAALLYEDRSIQHLFALPGLKIVAGHPFRGMQVDFQHAWFSQPRAVPAVTGAFLAMDRQVFSVLGGFDEELPTLAQDIDLCLKAQAAGFRNVTLPSLRLLHKEGRTKRKMMNWPEVALFYRKWNDRLRQRRDLGFDLLSRFTEAPAWRWPWRDFPIALWLWSLGVRGGVSLNTGGRVSRAWRLLRTDPGLFAAKTGAAARRRAAAQGIGLQRPGSGTQRKVAALGRQTEPQVGIGGRSYPFSHLLPSLTAEQPAGAEPSSVARVTVFVPVYRNVPVTRRCVESILSSRLPEGTRVLLQNDASPDPGMASALDAYRSDPRVQVVHNGANQGFVANVNFAIAWAGKDDLVVVNSDAEVSGDWLLLLAGHARRAARVATVTATSNHATICSFPSLGESAGWPGELPTEVVQKEAGAHNHGRSVSVPTAVGFCVYLTRAALDDVGGFDVEAFGKGYGEENDFSMRAARQGWSNLQALDVFVFHIGEISFGGSHGDKKQAAAAIIADRYPEYDRLVARHVFEDPGRGFRTGAALRLLAAGGRPVELLLTHGRGGGSQRAVDEFAQSAARSAALLVLKPLPGGRCVLAAAEPGWHVELTLTAADIEPVFLPLLRALAVRRFHLQHVIDFDWRFLEALRGSGLPFGFHVHDYWTVCPFVTMTTVAGRYCGEPDESGCNACIAGRAVAFNEALPSGVAWPQDAGASPIEGWRRLWSWIFRDAGAVHVPSLDAARRLGAYHPRREFQVRYHEDQETLRRTPSAPLLEPEEPLRVVIMGLLTPHKGLERVIEAQAAVRERGLPVEILVIGDIDGSRENPGMRKLAAEVMRTGPYAESELPLIVHASRAHLAWFPAGSPETYSYTLSHALRLGMPIMAPTIGSFIERLQDRELTWLLPYDAPVARLIELWLHCRQQWNVPAQVPPTRLNHGFLTTHSPSRIIIGSQTSK